MDSPDLTHLTRITSGPWQIGDVYRVHPKAEWHRIRSYYECVDTIEQHGLLWGDCEVWRYVPPTSPPQWIRSQDRAPKDGDYPIIVKEDGEMVRIYYATVALVKRPFVWMRFIEPVMPPPTQTDLDSAAYDKWFAEKRSTTYHPFTWHAGVEYGRTHPAVRA